MASNEVGGVADKKSTEKVDVDKVIEEIKDIVKKDQRPPLAVIAATYAKKFSQSTVAEIVEIFCASDDYTLNMLAEKFLAMTGQITQFNITAEHTKKDHDTSDLCVRCSMRCDVSCDQSRPNEDMIISMWKIADWKGIPFQFIFERILVFQHLRHQFFDHDWWSSTELPWLLRRAFVLCNVNDPKDETRLRRAFETIIAIFENRAGNSQLERKWFGEIGLLGSIRSSGGEGPIRGQDPISTASRRDMAASRLDARHSCLTIYRFITILHRAWIQSNNCSEVLRKAASTPLKYSDPDRQEVLAVLENKSTATPPTYLKCLYEEVGKVLFEHIMFGHLKTCGTCGATNRETQLLACKLCKTDKIRPKKWYCDVDCQIDDWSKHREEHAKHKEKKKAEKCASK